MASKLEVILSVVKEGFDNFGAAGKEIDGLKNKTTGLSSATSALSKSFIGILAPLASVAVAAGALHSALDMGDSVRKQADMLSMSTTAVQEWNYAAKQSGVESGSLTNAFSKLTQNIYNAQTGNKELSQTFKDWNIELTDSKGNLRTVTDIANDTMSALAGIKDPIERAGVAQQLLGKGARDLAPLLAQGTEALNEQKKAAQEHGQVLSEQAVDALDQAGDKLDEFSNSMKVASAEIVSKLTPAITGLAPTAIAAAGAIGKISRALEVVFGGNEEERVSKQIEKIESRIKRLNASVSYFRKTGEEDSAIQVMKKIQEIRREAEYLQGYLDEKKKPNNLNNTDQAFQNNAASSAFALRETQRKKTEEAEKKHNDALKKLQQDFQKDREGSFKDAEKQYNAGVKLQNDYNKDVEESYRDAEKNFKDSQNRKKKLDDQFERLSIANEKDETKRRRLELKQQQKEIESAYKEQVKAANGNAEEIAKANEIKNLSLRNSESSFAEWYKQSETNKRLAAKQSVNDTLSNTTDMFAQLAEKNKAWGNAYKASAISQTIISTYQGAQDSYTSLAKIPYVGVALGIAAAAVAVTSGLLRVNEIRKQNFASGTDGLNYGTWATLGEMGPELAYLPAGSQVYNHHKTNQIINNNQKGSSLVVNLYGENGKVKSTLERSLRRGELDYLSRQIVKRGART
jgi:hypothetical protein